MLKYNICDGNKEYGRLNDTLPLIEKENTLSNTAIVFILTFFGKISTASEFRMYGTSALKVPSHKG